MRMTGHLSDQSNVAIYWNARLENCYAIHAEKAGHANAVDYSFKEFSWYLQGRLNGDEDCAKRAQEMIEESKGQLEEPDLIRSAYSIRGLLSRAHGE